MKYLLVGMIKVYQLLSFRCHLKCRFMPTCSDYGIEAITRFGAFKGMILTLKRILRCNPFNKNKGYDPVPKEL